MPPLLADFIHARAYKPKCENFLARPRSMKGILPLFGSGVTNPIWLGTPDANTT